MAGSLNENRYLNSKYYFVTARKGAEAGAVTGLFALTSTVSGVIAGVVVGFGLDVQTTVQTVQNSPQNQANFLNQQKILTNQINQQAPSCN